MRDFLPLHKKHCYACINWDGNRTVYADEGKIKVDEREKAHCRLWHEDRAGSQECERFIPIC